MADYAKQPNVDPTSPVEITPGFIKQSIGGGGGSSRGPIRHRGGGNGMRRGSNEQQRQVTDVSHVTLEQNITVHTADKSKEDLATEEVYERVRGILSKLSPQKFKTLLQQMLQLPINTEERLNGCVDIFFEKVISEPSLTVAYANMALYMTRIQVQLDSDPTKTVAFQKLLLNKCQHEFEKEKSDEEDNLQVLIDGAESDERKKQLIETRNEAKRRSLGNIRFIGELFKLKMLTEKIMHECLRKLLGKNEDDHSLECLCQLLTIIGQDLDKKSQNMMNKYFADLVDLVDQKKTSSHIRFMIQDVIELRNNAWVPRSQNNNPKTIEQLHIKAKQEERKKQLALQKLTQDQRNRRDPPRGEKGINIWHRESSRGGNILSQECNKPTSTPNRFSALGAYGSESMDARNRTGSRVGSGYTGHVSGPGSRGPAFKQSEERSSNEPHFRSDTEETEISEAAEIEKKTKSLMDEYLLEHNIKEAALCVQELGTIKSLQIFVYHSLLQNLERSSQDRHFTGMLHYHLVNTRQITLGNYIEGLRNVLELAGDMVIHNPRIWEYIGELIFPMVEDGLIPLTFIRTACEPLQACDKAGVVVGNVLHQAARKLGHHKAAKLWLDSGLRFYDSGCSTSLSQRAET